MKSGFRLIEYDLPIRSLSSLKGKRTPRSDVDVKSAGIWWSRKPQHQCRSIWLATILPDPDSSSFPDEDRETLAQLLRDNGFLRTSDGKQSLRQSLISLCEYFADPQSLENDSNRILLARLADTLGANEFLALDPFSGSGAIPIEAARIGLNVIAGEYNPMAWLNLKFLLEDWSQLNEEQLEDVQASLNSLVDCAMNEVRSYFAKREELGQPYGYVRFRLLKCQGPRCGKIIPATSKFQLNMRDNIGITLAPTESGFALNVVHGDGTSFPNPTVKAGSVTCPACGYTTKRAEVMKQRDNYHLDTVIAAVAYRMGGDIALRDPADVQVAADLAARKYIETAKDLRIPSDHWPSTELRRFSPPLYGYDHFADCHTPRQRLYLQALARRVELLDDPIGKRLGALLLSRAVDANTSFCRWRSDRGGSVENTFAGKSVGMIWDFFESDPLHPEHDLKQDVGRLVETFRAATKHLRKPATVLREAAQQMPLPDDSVDIIYTDPPYYDSVPYAHLSDWPFVWVKQTGVFADGIAPDGLVEKTREIAVDRPHSKSPSTHNEAYFKQEIEKAFRECRRVLKPDGVAVIVFAHLNTSAWEALLEALVASGFRVTASWPVETERGGRLQAQGTASLQSSIHLVCRPLVSSDGGSSEQVGEWRDVLAELPDRIHEWLPRLASEGVVGADAIFACIGPALEVFSRYGRVEKASGDVVPLREYLEHIWAAVSTEALSMIFKDADAAGLEPDARLTAMWLWTLGAGSGKSANGNGAVVPEIVPDESSDDDLPRAKTVESKGYTLEFDAARKIAQGLGIHLEQSDSIVEIKGDKARLLPVSERTRHLFGTGEASAATAHGRKKSNERQRSLFAELDELEAEAENVIAGELKPQVGETVLDRVHQSMILFASGRGEALRRFLVDDGAGTDARFWKLAQSLSALYPKETDEKRWVDGVLARKKGLGL